MDTIQEEGNAPDYPVQLIAPPVAKEKTPRTPPKQQKIERYLPRTDASSSPTRDGATSKLSRSSSKPSFPKPNDDYLRFKSSYHFIDEKQVTNPFGSKAELQRTRGDAYDEHKVVVQKPPVKWVAPSEMESLLDQNEVPQTTKMLNDRKQSLETTNTFADRKYSDIQIIRTRQSTSVADLGLPAEKSQFIMIKAPEKKPIQIESILKQVEEQEAEEESFVKEFKSSNQAQSNFEKLFYNDQFEKQMADLRQQNYEINQTFKKNLEEMKKQANQFKQQKNASVYNLMSQKQFGPNQARSQVRQHLGDSYNYLARYNSSNHGPKQSFSLPMPYIQPSGRNSLNNNLNTISRKQNMHAIDPQPFYWDSRNPINESKDFRVETDFIDKQQLPKPLVQAHNPVPPSVRANPAPLSRPSYRRANETNLFEIEQINTRMQSDISKYKTHTKTLTRLTTRDALEKEFRNEVNIIAQTRPAEELQGETPLAEQLVDQQEVSKLKSYYERELMDFSSLNRLSIGSKHKKVST